MLGKSCNTGPRSSRYPAILGLITSFSLHFFYSSLYSTTSSCSSESHSASSLLLSEEIGASLDHLSGCSNDFGLVPLTFRVQELALMVRDERPFLHQHRKRLLVCFQYLYFKVIWEVLAVGLSTMRIHQMFEECWFCSYLFTFAVEFWDVFFCSTVHVFRRLTIVAGTRQKVWDVCWSSSLQAENAAYPVANTVTSTTDFVLWILLNLTLLVRALIPSKRICVNQRLL